MVGFLAAGFAVFGLTFGIGFADHTRFNASLKGIAGASVLSFSGGVFMSTKDSRMSEHINDEFNEEFSALGEFIAICSMLEATLHICLMRWLKIDEDVKRMIVGEPRIGDLLGLVKQSAQRAGVSGGRMALLERLHALAADNNKIRQIVAHKPMAPTVKPGHMSFHNGVTAKSEMAKYTYSCGIQELRNQAALVQHSVSCWIGLSVINEDLGVLKEWSDKLTLLQTRPLPTIPSPPPQPKPPKQQPQRPPSPA